MEKELKNYKLEVKVFGETVDTYESTNLDAICKKYIQFECKYANKGIIVYVNNKRLRICEIRDTLFGNKLTKLGKIFFNAYH